MLPMRSAGVVPCKQALCHDLFDVVPQWWLNTLFNKSWDKSLMIGYNLEQFANSPANLEHVTLDFDNLVDKNGTLSMIFHGIFTPLWKHARPSGRVMVSLSWNLCVQRKNKGSMTRRRARMPTLPTVYPSNSAPPYPPPPQKKYQQYYFIRRPKVRSNA